MKRTSVLILSEGKNSEEISTIFGDLPSAMVPLNGKPAIAWTIDNLLEQNLLDINITVGYKKEIVQEYLTEMYGEGKFKYIEADYKKPIGNSIINGIKNVESDRVLIILGDIIFKQKIKNFEKSFIMVSKEYTEPNKYCLARIKEGKIEEAYDRIKYIPFKNDIYALIGVYYFKNKNFLENLDDGNEYIEISDIITEYKKKDEIDAIICKNWFDISYIDKYYESKIKLLNTRFFNQLEYDSQFNIIYKKSITNKEKIKNEIYWYKHLPEELSIFTPKIIYSKSNDSTIAMEYINLPSLSELFLYGRNDDKIWERILNKILNTLRIFYRYKGEVKMQEYHEIYVNKTMKRMQKLINTNKIFREITNYDKININDEEYLNFFRLANKIEKYYPSLYKKDDNCIIHGDLCLPNILYDIRGDLIRLVDPRGIWVNSIYGDVKYDLAKLRHSFAGKYDFIINDRFEVEKNNNQFKYIIYKNKKHDFLQREFDKKISKEFDLEQIKFIEGLLFISMLPLHNDNLKRQIAMYCTGIKNLNEVLV
ncbi:MAG: sugar phosphate nucleotidyltransferase [Candidatus Micrarchaeia archaeon]